MSTLSLYLEQAATQIRAAEAAKLPNVRDRCLRAAAAWNSLAATLQAVEAGRLSRRTAKEIEERDAKACTQE